MVKLVLWGTGGRAREIFSPRLVENFQRVMTSVAFRK